MLRHNGIVSEDVHIQKAVGLIWGMPGKSQLPWTDLQETRPMSKYCPKCGSRNLKKAVICEKCGTQLVSGPLPPNPYATGTPSRYESEKEKTFMGIMPRSAAGMIIGLVVMLIGIVLIIYSFALFVGSAEGAAEDPLDTAVDIIGGFIVMVVGALMAAIGGVIFFIGMIWFFVKMLSGRH